MSTDEYLYDLRWIRASSETHSAAASSTMAARISMRSLVCAERECVCVRRGRAILTARGSHCAANSQFRDRQTDNNPSVGVCGGGGGYLRLYDGMAVLFLGRERQHAKMKKTQTQIHTEYCRLQIIG